MKYPWAERFIVLALRSLRKTHFDFNIWQLGQETESFDIKSIEKLNIGHGFELADERLVCASISQELLGSSTYSGVFVLEDTSKNIKAGIRYWQVSREKSYNYKPKESCDIVIDRYEIKDDGKINLTNEPIYIEAKRTCNYTVNLKTGKINRGSLNTQAILDDIKKLKNEVIQNKNNKVFNNLFIHLLIWGTKEIEKTTRKDATPHKFIDHLQKKNNTNKFTIHETKWFPTEWNDSTLKISK
jgi:hypothetical protein